MISTIFMANKLTVGKSDQFQILKFKRPKQKWLNSGGQDFDFKTSKTKNENR